MATATSGFAHVDLLVDLESAAPPALEIAIPNVMHLTAFHVSAPHGFPHVGIGSKINIFIKIAVRDGELQQQIQKCHRDCDFV